MCNVYRSHDIIFCLYTLQRIIFHKKLCGRECPFSWMKDKNEESSKIRHLFSNHKDLNSGITLLIIRIEFNILCLSKYFGLLLYIRSLRMKDPILNQKYLLVQLYFTLSQQKTLQLINFCTWIINTVLPFYQLLIYAGSKEFRLTRSEGMTKGYFCFVRFDVFPCK